MVYNCYQMYYSASRYSIMLYSELGPILENFVINAVCAFVLCNVTYIIEICVVCVVSCKNLSTRCSEKLPASEQFCAKFVNNNKIIYTLYTHIITHFLRHCTKGCLICSASNSDQSLHLRWLLSKRWSQRDPFPNNPHH